MTEIFPKSIDRKETGWNLIFDSTIGIKPRDTIIDANEYAFHVIEVYIEAKGDLVRVAPTDSRICKTITPPLFWHPNQL